MCHKDNDRVVRLRRWVGCLGLLGEYELFNKLPKGLLGFGGLGLMEEVEELMNGFIGGGFKFL